MRYRARLTSVPEPSSLGGTCLQLTDCDGTNPQSRIRLDLVTPPGVGVGLGQGQECFVDVEITPILAAED